MGWRGGSVWFVATMLVVPGGGCGTSGQEGERESRSPRQARTEKATLSPQQVEALKVESRQVVYVPIYSHVYFSDGRRSLNLTALLSIRNTDRRSPIVIKRVDYHGTDGKLVRSDLKAALKLEPLAVTEVVLPERDMTGGSGASFLVEWVAEETVSEPVIESVMIGTMGSQGISFVCPGRVLEP